MGLERPQNQVIHPVNRVQSGRWTADDAVLASEEPLEIRLLWQQAGRAAQKSIAIMMRTPGDDFALATGFLFGEAIVNDPADIVDVSHCPDDNGQQTSNVVAVTLRPGVAFDPARLERNFFASSSCGVCGKATLDALAIGGCSFIPTGFHVSAATVCGLPDTLKHAQAVFATTGGLHATGLFDRDGVLKSAKEDVGRHNALDKLVGERLLEGESPLEQYALMLSGRASFELVQKALRARIPVVAAVGAPSSLAVQLADSFGITLVGFVRPDGFTVYAGRERIVP